MKCAPHQIPIRVFKSRSMRREEHVACIRKKRNAYRILVGQTKCKRPFLRSKSIRESDTKIDVKGTGWQGVDLIRLAQDMGKWWAPINTVTKFRVP
jgi:hypothetical protein